jgi:hypothetical protein
MTPVIHTEPGMGCIVWESHTYKLVGVHFKEA